MIKIVALIKRRSDVTREEFREYYEYRHAPLFHRAIPAEVAGAIRHYVQNHALQLGRGSTEAPFDCVTEVRQLLGWRAAGLSHAIGAQHHLVHHAVMDGDEELLLGADVVIKRTLTEVVGRAQLCDARGVVATASEHPR